ncbi:MAG: NAD(P)/FAD-dependent oxidoreductase, partial [Candidatus Puniceispirillaceae bacterium]
MVIIGGGYTGFGAAIPLARAGLDVVILERDQIGSGASTRNGGITSGNLRLSFDDLTKRFGAKKAVAFYQEAKAARADLAQFITSEKIDCDLQQCGRLVGALRSESLDSMKRDAERLTKLLDIEAKVYNQNSLPDYIDTSRYCGGMMRDDIGGIHPAKLLAGMCQIAREASVEIATQTKMIAVSRQNTSSTTPEFRIETSRGIIHAGHVISATNAYTDGGQPWLRRRLVPVISEMIATEEVGENMVKSLMPGLNMYGEALQLGHYYRPSPDGKRILLGGRRMSPDPVRARKRLVGGLASIFPQLSDIGITNHWFGFVAFPFDQLPKLAVHDGVIYPAGYCGSGTVWARWLGQKAAHMVLADLDGSAFEGSAFQGVPFRTMPFYSGDPWFLPMAMGLY